MKTKTVYVATKPVYLTDARGNTKELPVGHELTEREYRALNDARRAKFTAKTVTVGKPAFIHMTVGQIPAEARIIDGQWHVGADELHLLRGDVRALAEENRALWCAAFPEIAWPGIHTGRYHGDRVEGRLTWFLDGLNLPGNLPAMYAQQGVPCKLSPKKARARKAYQYDTAALSKTTERLRRGAEIFAYDEAIERLLAEVRG